MRNTGKNKKKVSKTGLLILLALCLIFISSEMIFTDVHHEHNDCSEGDDYCHLVSNTIHQTHHHSQGLTLALILQTSHEILPVRQENQQVNQLSAYYPLQEKSLLFFLESLLI